MKKTTIIGIFAILLIIGGTLYLFSKQIIVNNLVSTEGVSTKEKPLIKIGVVTDLSSSAASYWGESTRVGAEIAKKELQKIGYNIDVIFEDYQLDATKAVTSAQRLVNIDGVDALYSDFAPAVLSISPIVKNKDILYVYEAAVTSPLKNNPNIFKSYLDYQVGCKEIAHKFKDQGSANIGMIKANLEFGELCLAGLKDVYGDNVFSESFNLGETDFKTQVLKLKNTGVGAITNASFEEDTLNTLKAMKELNFKVPFGTVADTVTSNVISKYSDMLKGAWTFGFMAVDKDFSAKVLAEAGKKLASDYGAAIAYTHILQMVKAIDKCSKEISCVDGEMSKSPEDKTIGFKEFNNRVADLSMVLKQY